MPSRTSSVSPTPSRGRVANAARVAGVALPLGALSTLVFYAPRFSHDARFLAFLREVAPLTWLLALGWGALLAVRWRLDGPGTAAVVAHPGRWGAALGAVLVALASPFMNAYFTHVTHPVLAVCLAWAGLPLAAKIMEAARRLTPEGPRGGERIAPWLAAVIAATFVFVQTYRRHLWFGSGGKDLGLFHQSVWLLSRFEAPRNTVMGMHAFADHMEGVDLLAAPLQWLWPGAGALLLFQAILAGAAVVPIVWLARDRLGSTTAGLGAAVVFLLGIDVQQGLMFDWNPTTCGALLMPWVAWTFERRAPAPFAVAVALVALCKENLVLYALGLCLALALGAEDRRTARRGVVAAVALGVLFVVEMKILFPLFRDEGFRHVRFEALGLTPGEIVATVAGSPFEAFALLFTPGRKIDGLLSPLSTVAYVCVLAPRYALALLPVVFERFWSTHENRWWGHHYGTGAGVVAVLAAIDGLARLERGGRHQLQPIALGAVLLSCLLVAGTGRFGPAPLWVWRHPYYTTPADRAAAEHVLAAVPPDVSVAAQNHLLPHLSARHEIFEIRRPIRAEWVVLDFAQSAWPFGASYAKDLARELLGRGYGVVACEGEAVALQRDAASIPCEAL